MPAPKFAHVVFQTGQPEQMRDWYCAVLDGHVVYQDGEQRRVRHLLAAPGA